MEHHCQKVLSGRESGEWERHCGWIVKAADEVYGKREDGGERKGMCESGRGDGSHWGRQGKFVKWKGVSERNSGSEGGRLVESMRVEGEVGLDWERQ